MGYIDPRYLEHQAKRFIRQDWQRYMRPDWRDRRYWVGEPPVHPFDPPPQASQSARKSTLPSAEEIEAAERERLDLQRSLNELRLELAAIKRDLLLQKAFNPNQPRVSAGNPDGGQWTSGEASGRNDPRVLSDATPVNDWKPGAQYAQSRGGRGARPGQMEPGQAARLTVAEARAQDAIRRVREIDPNWKPTPSLRETVEGAITTAEAEAREAQTRLDELARNGIGPGPFAGESVPARGPARDFTASERREINRIGSETGCHTCGTLDPGTNTGNFVPDHQPPNALNPLLRPQRLFPQCLTCSAFQGGWITGNRRMR